MEKWKDFYEIRNEWDSEFISWDSELSEIKNLLRFRIHWDLEWDSDWDSERFNYVLQICISYRYSLDWDSYKIHSSFIRNSWVSKNSNPSPPPTLIFLGPRERYSRSKRKFWCCSTEEKKSLKNVFFKLEFKDKDLKLPHSWMNV